MVMTPVFELVDSWMAARYFSGASFLLADQNGTICERYWGSQSPASVVYLASAGKWLAAATILSVVDSGHIDLEDCVSKWMPAWNDAKGRATLRQMLAHTSGYPAYQPAGAPPDIYQTLAESVAHLAPLDAETLAGTHWNYGGLAMQVAGHMAELATGRDWETLFQERIAGPLGMTATHFTPVDASRGHNPMLGGGARGTLRDYARFLSMMFNYGMAGDKRVLSRTALELIEANQVQAAHLPIENFVYEVRPHRHRGIYGLGVWREIENEQGTATLISSPSWAGTYPWIDREAGIYGIFLTHVSSHAPTDFNPMFASAEIPIIIRKQLTH